MSLVLVICVGVDVSVRCRMNHLVLSWGLGERRRGVAGCGTFGRCERYGDKTCPRKGILLSATSV